MGFIYGLYDPTTDELRYVGQVTKSTLPERLSDHLYGAKKGRKYWVYNWIRRVLAQGNTPIIKPIEAVPDRAAADRREQHWIARCKAEGIRLTNRTSGGEGFLGNHTDETKRKISESKKAQHLPAHNKGIPPSEESKQKNARAHLGNKYHAMPHTEATRQKLSVAFKGKPWPEARRLAQQRKELPCSQQL